MHRATADPEASSPVLDLARALIRRPSVTPEDAGCQELIATRLSDSGFRCRQFDFEDVRNLVAWHGAGAPVFAFLGHTDVVPPGPAEAWSSPPFEPTLRDGCLYGRGAADMKGAVAAMVLALERFVAAHPDHPGTVGLILTSDEEGPAEHGVRRVMSALADEGLAIDYCLVGEPSSSERVGDVVRIGRRGSLNLELTVHGVQGHVAFPELADNPVHAALPALAELTGREWDAGDAHFPPTGFQIAQVTAGSGPYNVIPGTLRIRCNFRYGPMHEPEGLIASVRDVLERHRVRHTLDWQDSGRPFITPGGPLVEATRAACVRCLGAAPIMNTGGGTSDGRFVAPTGAQVVELGAVNATIHQVDEWMAAEDLDTLTELYEMIMGELMTAGAGAGRDR